MLSCCLLPCPQSVRARRVNRIWWWNKNQICFCCLRKGWPLMWLWFQSCKTRPDKETRTRLNHGLEPPMTLHYCLQTTVATKTVNRMYNCVPKLCTCVLTKSLQSCPTLCDPMDCSPPGSSMGFSRQEYGSGLPHPPPGDLSNPGIKPTSITSPALAGGFFTTSTTWEAQAGCIPRHYIT